MNVQCLSVEHEVIAGRKLIDVYLVDNVRDYQESVNTGSTVQQVILSESQVLTGSGPA